jgi:hypothetical protein
MRLPAIAVALALSGLGPPARAAGPSPGNLRAFPLDVHDFRVLERDSGPRNYYRTMSEVEQQEFIRGVYNPSLKTVTLFAPVPDELHRGVRSLRFRWRALVLPRGGNECKPGLGDGAANVYVTWKRGMRWYSVKLVWSSEAPVGATCNSTRNALVASDSVIVRSGGPTGVWQEVEVAPDTLFRAHFEGGRADAEVPELQGIGILTDGDQTHSVSAADYAGFALYKDRERTASH